ncbi:sigma-70 family RNA polymerase sigma factor [Methylocaldum szegediense]|nr:sigma-70 family RNA polymerase sigma factor [Methylocaldum szegediense]
MARMLLSRIGYLLQPISLIRPMSRPITDSMLAPWGEGLMHDLFCFFRQRVGCPDTAADLTQETQLRVWQSTHDNRVDNPRAFAFRVAENLVVDHRRRQAVREICVPLEDEHADTVAGFDPAPEHCLEQKERLRKLNAALSELPEKCRTALLLNRLEGLSHREIAARLNVSESMIAKYLARAMRHCRSRVDDPSTR